MLGIILEGVTGSGKSRILAHLQRLLATEMPSNTKLFLSEHYSERVLEHRRELGLLTPSEVLEHLRGILDLLAPLEDARTKSKFQDRGGSSDVLVVIERFLLGHITNMKMAQASSWQLTPDLRDAMEQLYQRADQCGFLRVVLRVHSEALPERILSTRRYRNAAWIKHLQMHGSDAAIVSYYHEWQHTMLEYCKVLHHVVRPIYYDIGSEWDDKQYEAAAYELQRLFRGVAAKESRHY